MAFGDLLASATNASTNPGASQAAGPVTVAVGNLAAMNMASNGVFPANLVISDNLGNTWTALTTNSNNNDNLAKWWSLITVAGSMTVTLGFDSQTSDMTTQLAVFEGTYEATPRDKNPANNADVALPYNCPATGTLAQADELVLGFGANVQGITDYAATAPSTLGPTSASGTGAGTASGAISYRVVAATTTVTPAFTGTEKNWCGGTATFEKAAVVAFHAGILSQPSAHYRESWGSL